MNELLLMERELAVRIATARFDGTSGERYWRAAKKDAWTNLQAFRLLLRAGRLDASRAESVRQELRRRLEDADDALQLAVVLVNAPRDAREALVV